MMHDLGGQADRRNGVGACSSSSLVNCLANSCDANFNVTFAGNSTDPATRNSLGPFSLALSDRNRCLRT